MTYIEWESTMIAEDGEFVKLSYDKRREMYNNYLHSFVDKHADIHK